MRRLHRLPAHFIRWASLSVCFALILSGLTIIPAKSSGKGPISFTQGRGQRDNGKARKVNPAPPRPGAPEGSLPNLDEARQRQTAVPEARPPIPSTARSKRKPLESRRGRKVGDPLPPKRRASTKETRDGSERVSSASADAHDRVGFVRSHHARTKRLLPQAVSTEVEGSHPSAALNLLKTNHSEFHWLRYPGFDFLRYSTIQFDSAAAILDSRKSLWPLAAINFKYGGFDFLAAPIPQAGISRIVFTSNRDGSTQIYVMNSDGSVQTPLTYNTSNDDNPRWSPNGAKILFQSDRDNSATGFMDIYVMNPDGSGQTRLTSDANDDSAAVWSSDGTKIAFQSFRNGVTYQVYVMNADGGGQVNISNNTANDTQPSWSPDGAKIAFASDRDQAGCPSIYVMNVNGTNQTRLTFSGSGLRDEQSVWSPNATKLVFVSTRDSIVETWQETDDDGGIVIKSELHVNKEIYVMTADGTNQIRLTNDLSNDDSPSWSPDGTKIVFRSDRERDCCDPTAQVWTMNPDGSNQISLSNNEFGDYSASWIGIDSSASQLADSSPTGNQPPVANAGGSLIGLAGQAVQFNGCGSFDPDGTIVTYSWNFGDGTSGTGPNPTHQYNADGEYSVWLSVGDNSGNWTSSAGFVTVGSVSLPVRLTFDELPNNTTVADQYLSQYGVRFSSTNFFYPVHTYQNCGLTCSATSSPNFISTKPDDTGQIIVAFTQPVSNLVFYAIGVDTLSGTFAWVDVYRNGSPTPSNIYPLNGVFSTTVGFTSGSLDNISKVVIRGITDPAGIGFDDFSFSVPSDIKITNARVSGYLNGTTQNALLGGDVALNATPLPGGFAGGTYAWTCTPVQLCSIVAGSNSSSVTLRTTDVGTITANVSYTKNGLTASGSVTINSMLPTLTSFTAQQQPETIWPPFTCGTPDEPYSRWWYRKGCRTGTPGIHFIAHVSVDPFISDPTKSGVKYVQATSTFHKFMSRGVRCHTRRVSESDVASGWQLDTIDPITSMDFSGLLTAIGIDADDSPGVALTWFTDYEFKEALYVDDRFEMYLVYYSGSDPHNPPIQRPLRKYSWNYGGLVVFDPSESGGAHRIRSTNAVLQSPSSTFPLQNLPLPQEAACPGGPPLTDNRIDSSRELVKYYYLDILRRNPDASGWDYHTSNIAQCVFDSTCLITMRSQGALGFFFSPEFIQLIGPEDPVMANPPGSANFNPAEYNPRFIFWCYDRFLRRAPDPGGFDFYMNILNTTGDYRQVVFGFIYSPEYRSREFQ